jgi:hypothetical protein
MVGEACRYRFSITLQASFRILFWPVSVIVLHVNRPEFEASATWRTYSEEQELSESRVADSDLVGIVALTGGSRTRTGNNQFR